MQLLTRLAHVQHHNGPIFRAVCSRITFIPIFTVHFPAANIFCTTNTSYCSALQGNVQSVSCGCASYYCHGCCASKCLTSSPIQFNGTCLVTTSCPADTSVVLSTLQSLPQIFVAQASSPNTSRSYITFCLANNCNTTLAPYDCSICTSCNHGYLLCNSTGLCVNQAAVGHPLDCTSMIFALMLSLGAIFF